MAVWTIDGTIESVEAGRSGWGQAIYKSVAFRDADGNAAEQTKFVVAHDLKHMLEPGRSGRFYFHKTVDQNGLHGVRSSEGEAYVFPSLLLKSFAIMLVICVPSTAFNWMNEGIGSIVTLFGLIGIAIGAIMLPLTLKARNEAKAQFEGDGGYSAPSD